MPAPNGTVTMVVNAIDQPETQDPLGLSRAQLSANPRQSDPSATQFNTRKSVRQSQVGLVYDMNVGGADKVQARTYLGDRQVTQFQAIPLAAQLAPTSSGAVVDQDFGYEGIGVRWTHNIREGRAAAQLHHRRRLRPHGPASHGLYQQLRHPGRVEAR